MARMRISIARLDGHASAVGYLCFYFAEMEHLIGEFISAVLNCDDSAGRVISHGIGSVSGRCDVLRKLLYASPIRSVEMPHGRAWIDMPIRLLDEIADDICPARNRLVHDRWNVLSGDQIDTRPTVKRPQSRQQKTIAPPAVLSRDVDETWGLIFQIRTAILVLADLTDDYRDWRGGRPLLEHSEQFQQWLLHGRHDDQR